MLFNSYEFILLFLPVTFLVYFIFARKGQELAIAWLVLASLFFYGWWNPAYLVMIIGSTIFNFSMGRVLATSPPHSRRGILSLAVGANLCLLGYYKYANFFVDARSSLAASDIAAVVVSAVDGVQVMTEKMWEVAEEVGLPKAIIINKQDRERANFASTLKDVQDNLSKRAAP